MIGGRQFQSRQIFFVTDISERNADVSQKSATLDSFDRRIAKEIAKLSFAHRQIIAERKASCRASGGERGLVRDLSEAIPRACIEAIVATENPIADQRPKGDTTTTFATLATEK